MFILRVNALAREKTSLLAFYATTAWLLGLLCDLFVMAMLAVRLLQEEQRRHPAAAVAEQS